jgi:hypothetical protein
LIGAIYLFENKAMVDDMRVRLKSAAEPDNQVKDGLFY